MRDHLILYLNGRGIQVRGEEEAAITLSDFLRRRKQLTGTKVVCAEGDCGACAVLLGRLNAEGNLIEYSSVNSCIQLMFQLDATHVVTVEGLKDGNELNPIQQAMVECHGAQCGYCTPGFVVSLYDVMQSRPLHEHEVRRGLVGNLCRCTGYDSIIRAAMETDKLKLKSLNVMYPPEKMLQRLSTAATEMVKIEAGGFKFCKPVTPKDAAEFRSQNPASLIVTGATDIGVQCNKGTRKISTVMSMAGMKSLRQISLNANVLSVGATATLSDLERAAEIHLPELCRFLAFFGSPLIKNSGTLAGNIVNASPIGDTIPALMVLDGEVELLSVSGTRTININQFYTGYRKTVMAENEIVSGVRIPLPARGDIYKLYKVSRRKDLDISSFGAAIWMRKGARGIDDVRIAFGGVGPVVLRMKRVEDFLRGKIPSLELFEQAGLMAAQDVTPITDVRGSKDYRRVLAGNILVKFWHEIDETGGARAAAPTPGPGRREPSMARSPEKDLDMNFVGKNIPHDSAVTHVAGESMFIDDTAPLSRELLAGIVPSPFAHGKLNRLDISAAKNIPGVVAIFTAKDIPGHNLFGPAIKDELLIVEGEAVFLGQPVVIIAAETAHALEAAKNAVVVEMTELPAILTIDDAISANSYIGTPRNMSRGDAAAGFAKSAHKLNGVLEIGGQEHFYLESMAAIAIPGEQGAMTVHSSTQHTSEVQAMVAEVLDVPFNHVSVICKRMGGAFGGKETQAAQPAMMAALLAAHTRRPVRFVYTKDDDMRFTGKRHPFKIVYHAGFDNDGVVNALELELFSNGGCSADLSFAVLERAMLHSDNAYFFPNVKITGRVCKTNLPSNTAFRGFGGPQGVAGIENIIEEIAAFLARDALDVRQSNCYGIEDRNITQYGQIVRNNTLSELFSSLRRECNYDTRRAEIRKFNQESATHLRGMSLTAVKFGISFTRRTMNQANALVNIYLDGSVMVSTGATEMGQGVNTRIRQIVADELGVEYAKVIVTATNTDKNNNTSPTAASSGTDLNGAAAADACKRLRGRLAEIAANMLARPADGLSAEPTCVRFEMGKVIDTRSPRQSIDFGKVVLEAYEQRVNLGERGFFATPGVDFNRETGKGSPFLYFTNGVACSEVIIDRFTGEMHATRVDMIMDVGKSINPGIDRGQIVGGFIQGMGWVTTEELVYSAKGNLLSCSPTTYKIPAVTDLPEQFNVRFLDNPHNDVSIYRSKAVGEPPLLLGISVWLAVKNAISHLSGSKEISLSIPATGERILLAMHAAKAGAKSAVAAG